MQIKRENPTPTSVKLTVSANATFLHETKERVLKRLGTRMKVAGFRAGKAPLNIVERNADPALLQSEFLEAAVNQLYGDAATQEKLRPVSVPQVEIIKFVPFTTLEFRADVDVVGDVKLPDYTKMKLAKQPVKITDADIDDVIETLRARAATKTEVKRAAKDGDEVTIDFAGHDAETKEPINGADGKGYPLVLGSDTFIPGFETHLVGLKAGEQKTFTLEFPKDYSVAALRSRKVTFDVSVAAVRELAKPAVNDEFATTVGPFKSLTALKDDIRSQLLNEKEYENDRNYESELLKKIADEAKVAIPDLLIDEEMTRLEQQVRQNLAYRAQTWQEHLAALGKTEEAYRAELRKDAAERVKAGLVLSEIADKENVQITKAELDLRLQLLKGQYHDAAMQAELDKPDNQRTIISNMLSEKTLARLTELATAAAPAKK